MFPELPVNKHYFTLRELLRSWRYVHLSVNLFIAYEALPVYLYEQHFHTEKEKCN